MTEVLRQKLAATRAPKRPAGVSVEALLRKTMPRDADAAVSLDISVTSFQSASEDKPTLLESLAPTDLVYLVQSAEGARGIVRLDKGLVSALIEVQMSGRVAPSPPGDRRPTRTDGIVAGEIVDRWLETAQAVTGEAGLDAAWPLLGFDRADGIVTRREVDLLLEPVEFRTVDIALSLDQGTRTGTIRFAAPRLVPLLEQRDTTTSARIRSHLPHLPVELRVVLANLPTDMARARGMQVGDLFPLPDQCLQSVRLESACGKLIRRARLGQLGKKKAVRLSDAAAAPGPLSGAMDMPALAPPVPSPEPLADLMPPAADIDAGPELPELPDLPDLPDLDLPSDGPGPELPDLPPVPAAADDGSLPDLPPLPDLPELPEIS